MSAVKGVNKTLYDTVSTGDNVIPKGEFRTTVKCITDEYTCAALADASTIAIANLPAGATVIDVSVFHADLGTSVTVAIGDTNTAGLYLAATTVAALGRLDMNVVAGFGYVIGTNDDDNVILLTTAGTTTGILKVRILYTT